MLEWDRYAIIGVGLFVVLYTCWDARKLWKRRRYLALVGVALLVLGTLGVPLALVVFGS